MVGEGEEQVQQQQWDGTECMVTEYEDEDGVREVGLIARVPGAGANDVKGGAAPGENGGDWTSVIPRSRARALEPRGSSTDEATEGAGEEDGSEAGSDDDSVASCRSASATTSSFGLCSLESAGNPFSILSRILPCVEEGSEGDEDSDEDWMDMCEQAASTYDVPGSAGPQGLVLEGATTLAAGLRPHPLSLLPAEQASPKPSLCVVAGEDAAAEAAEPTVEAVWNAVLKAATTRGGLDVEAVSNEVLSVLVSVVSRLDADMAGDLSQAVGVESVPPVASISASGSEPRAVESERGARDRPPLPSSGQLPTMGTRGHHRYAIGTFIGDLRSLLPGRHPGRIPKRASPSNSGRPDVQCEADGQAIVGGVTGGKDAEVAGRRLRRLRRRQAVRTPLSQGLPERGGAAALGMPPKQFQIPAQHLIRKHWRADGKTHPSRPTLGLGEEEELRARSWQQVGTKLGNRARRCLQEVYFGIAAVMSAAECTVDLGGGRKAPRYTTLVLDVAVGRQGAKAMVDTGAEVSCISARFLDSRWHALAPYYSQQCPMGLRAADGDALQLEGMLHVPVKVGSKSYNQALFVVTNLKDQVLLGLDFLTTAKAVIDVSSQRFTFGSQDARETVLLSENAELSVGAIGTGQQTHLVRAAEDKTIMPGDADHVRVELDPPAQPGLYELSSRHLVTEDEGAMWCDGLFEVPEDEGAAQAPLHVRMIHGADEKPLRIEKGQVVSVALPPLRMTVQGNPVFAGLGEVRQKMELKWWDEPNLPRPGSGKAAQYHYLLQQELRAMSEPATAQREAARARAMAAPEQQQRAAGVQAVRAAVRELASRERTNRVLRETTEQEHRKGGSPRVKVGLPWEKYTLPGSPDVNNAKDEEPLPAPPREPVERDPRVAAGTLKGHELAHELFREVAAVAALFEVTVDMDESDMAPETKKKFVAMVQRKIDAFTPDKEIPGCTNLEELYLNTGTHAPVAVPPRRLPYSQEPMVFAQIQSWLKHGIIRASSSAWSAPVVVIMRNDKFRLAIDYRELNKRLSDEHMNYPLTLIDSCLDVMNGSQFFTTVDISGAFHQIPVAKDSIEKTAFVSKWGQYEFLRAPFGIKSMPGVWSRLADKVLKGLKWQIAAVYMDDIIVFSKTGEDHVRDVEQVLSRIIDAGLKIHISKCKWAKSEVEYVGFIVGCDGVRPMPEKVAAIRDFPRPTNIHELRSFLSLASYYRRFIRGFSTTAGPMTELLQKKVKWHWGEQQEQAFVELRTALASPPVLAFPNFNLPFELHTDASTFGISAILHQRRPGDTADPPNVICFASRALRGNEKTYSPTHLEALAVRWAVEKFRPYLYGTKFTIFTDHKALEHIQSCKDSTGQLFRWSLFLQDFDFEIKYRPGRHNQNADVLSRFFAAARVNSIRRHRTVQPKSWSAMVQAIRIDAAADGATVEARPQSGGGEDDGGRDAEGDLGLEDVGPLLGPPTYIPQWKQQRLWALLSAGAEMQRQLGGSGRAVTIADPGYGAHVSAVRGAPARTPTVTTHVNAALDAHTEVPLARADDDGWSFSVDVLLEQKADPELAPLRDYIESAGAVLPEGLTEKEQEAFRWAAKAYYIRTTDQVLCRMWRSSRGVARSAVFHQVVVPSRLREVVLEAYHDHALGGHTGLGRLYERIMRKYYWPSLLKDATAHVKGCDICNKRKNPPRRAVSDWAHRELAWKPFQRVSLDFTPMGTTTKSGNNSFLLCVDHLTHFVEVWPCSNETSEVVLKALTDLTTRYGVPQEIISDNGSHLVAKVVKDLAKGLGAKKSTTAPYRHEANGLAERAIQSFQGLLRQAIEEGHQDEWDEFIDVARFAHNTSFNTSVGECPFFLLYGTDPNVPLDLILQADQPHYANLKDYTDRLANRLRKAWDAARTMNEKTRDTRYRKHQERAKHGFTKFETNARVYVYAPQHKLGLSRKLTAPWSGPYRIIGEHIPGVYVVKPADGKTGQDIRVHVSRLKPYVTWAASYVARARHHRRAFLDNPQDPLLEQPPAPRAVRDRQQQPRQPTETELSLVDKFFEDPAEGALWKIQAVAWDDEAGQMAAYAVRIRRLRKGHYAVAQKKGVPMEPVAIEEAQEWVANSHLLNRALAPGEH